MKNRVCRTAGLLVALWLQSLLPVHAFTLAEAGGKVVIGRSLDVTVRVQSDADEEVSSACVSAEVMYGDSRQSDVRITVLAGHSDTSRSTLRVQSAAFVDEPVVTLVVRATCGTSTQRSYVLLAEFPTVANMSGVAAANTPVQAPPVLVLPPKESAPGSAVDAAVATKPVVQKKPEAVIKPQAQSDQPSVKHATSKAGSAGKPPQKRSKVERATGKAILKLDPLDIFSDRLDGLDSPMLFAATEDALLLSQKVTSLEGDVKLLRSQAASNDAKMSQLRLELQAAQANQIPAWLVYGIGLLVLACCTGLGWLVWYQRRLAQEKIQADWWNEVTSDARDDRSNHQHWTEGQPKVAQTAVATPVAPRPSRSATSRVVPDIEIETDAPQAQTPSDVDLDFNLDHVLPDESLHGSFEFNTVSAPFEPHSIRHISVEPILDIRQQAEFFVSLGQTDRAMLILKKQIAESTEPNPLVYLDLISLYHTVGLKTDFRECSVAFHQLFNGVIPDFPAFLSPGKGIEDYPNVISQLIPLWPRTEALVFLTACIFHDANAAVRQTFDLTAFRDLLMLHAIVETLNPDAAALDFDLAGPIG